MFQQNIRLIFRNFKRSKGAFFINLVGLSTGLACTFLIYLWVQDEQHVDRFHAQGDHLYRVMANHEHTDIIDTKTDVPGLLAPALKAEFPEVEMAVSTSSGSNQANEMMTVSANDLHFKAPARFASHDFFKMFSYELIEGDKDQVLTSKNDAVISASLATKLFGSPANAPGKMMDWEIFGLKNKVVITGVFKEVPTHSSEVFDLVLDFNYFEQDLIGQYAHWRNYYAYAYVTLKPGTDVAAFDQKIQHFMLTKADDSKITLFLKKSAKLWQKLLSA